MFQPEEFDRPRPEDFAPPYFYFSTRDESKVCYVTPSMYDVLGFDPIKVLGRRCSDFLIKDDPLNADYFQSDPLEVPEDQTHGALRAVNDVSGDRRVLYVHTTALRDRANHTAIRKHSIARDVTDDIGMTLVVRRRIEELRQHLSPLSERDRWIAEAAAKGMTNESVAEKLDVSIRTIERRRNVLRQKFGVDHVALIVAMVSELNCLEGLWETQSRQPWLAALNLQFSDSF